MKKTLLILSLITLFLVGAVEEQSTDTKPTTAKHLFQEKISKTQSQVWRWSM